MVYRHTDRHKDCSGAQPHGAKQLIRHMRPAQRVFRHTSAPMACVAHVLGGQATEPCPPPSSRHDFNTTKQIKKKTALLHFKFAAPGFCKCMAAAAALLLRCDRRSASFSVLLKSRRACVLQAEGLFRHKLARRGAPQACSGTKQAGGLFRHTTCRHKANFAFHTAKVANDVYIKWIN